MALLRKNYCERETNQEHGPQKQTSAHPQHLPLAVSNPPSHDSQQGERRKKPDSAKRIDSITSRVRAQV